MKTNASAAKSIALVIALLLTAFPTAAQKRRAAAQSSESKAAASVDEGDRLAGENKYPQAIEAYQAAIRLYPKSAAAFGGLGDAYLNSGNAEQALAAYQEEERLAPNDPQAHYDLGYFYNATGRYGAALAPLSRAKQLKPSFVEAFYAIGYAYLQTGDYEEAIGYFSSTVRLRPGYSDAYYGMGQAQLKSGNIELAKEQLRKLSTLDGRLALKLESEIQRATAQTTEAATTASTEKPVARMVDSIQAKPQPTPAKTQPPPQSTGTREPTSRQLQQLPPAQNQSTQPASAASQLDQIKSLPASGKRWALVIGVDKYVDPQISPLKGSDNDARMISDALVRYAGFPQDQVILLSTSQPIERQPTRVNILRRLANLSTTIPKDGLLLVSFAGHGMERNGQAFLLPADAQISDSISFLEETAISMSRIKSWIKETGVGQVVMLLDACRNDPGGRADAPNPLSNAYVNAFNFDVRNREIQAFATVYATGIGQRAYEYTEKKQGYFSWAVVEGLKGGAANDKGEVTLSQLVKYVQDAVPKRIAVDLGSTKQQKPFAIIEGYRADELVLAVTNGATNASNSSIPNVNAVDPAAIELSYWDTIKNSSNPDDFKSYLDKYPDGQFASLAKSRANSFRPANNYPSGGSSESPEMLYWNAIKDSQNPADFRAYIAKFPQGLFVELANNRIAALDAKASGRSPATAAGLTSGPATIKDIEVAFKSNMYDETIRVATRFLEATPDSKEAHAYLGLALLAKKDADSAVLHLERAIVLGQPINFPAKRLREPLIGHALDEVTVAVTADSVVIQSGKTFYRAPFSGLKDSKINTYQNQCSIAFLKGAFTESSANSDKVGKPSDKGFNIFPPATTLRPVQQNNLNYNVAYCYGDDGIIPTTIIKLIYRLSANK